MTEINQEARAAAKAAYWNTPIDLCGDHDSEQEKAVDAAIRAATESLGGE